MVSPSSRHALMSKKSTSSFLERTRLTANPKEQTGTPSPSISTNLSSGSLVRLPARITLLKLAMSQPPFVLGTALRPLHSNEGPEERGPLRRCSLPILPTEWYAASRTQPVAPLEERECGAPQSGRSDRDRVR